MIALVGVKPPSANVAGVAVVPALPATPATRYCGAIVRCADSPAVRATLSWFTRIHALRPTFVLGLVVEPRFGARAIGSLGVPVSPVLYPADLEGGRLPAAALHGIRERSIEGAILEEIAVEFGRDVLKERQTLELIIAHGIRGGTVGAVARELGYSPVTLWRRLARMGIRTKRLMAQVRLRAYQLRIGYGTSAEAARHAGGWNSRAAHEKSAGRWRDRSARR